MNPVSSYGGNVCCTGNALAGGALDQRKMEARADILVYTTEPLREGIEVSGPLDATLYVSSDAKDTDFTVKVIDVYPDGKAYNLDETIQRARYRDDRNMNTGGNNYDEAAGVVAHNAVHHSQQYPSQITVSVVKRN